VVVVVVVVILMWNGLEDGETIKVFACDSSSSVSGKKEFFLPLPLLPLLPLDKKTTKHPSLLHDTPHPFL
jgi:hypothetical protein